MKTISAKTDNQKEYIKAILENDIVICDAIAGVGKSYIALGVALELLFKKDSPYKKIYVTKPLVSCGSTDFPTLPGTIEEKIGPYFNSILYIAKNIIGHKETMALVEKKIIDFSPIEFMRGYTIENAILICDEVQNSTEEQIEMLITRMGAENCKMIFIGDLSQKDIYRYSGLDLLKDALKNTNLVANVTLGLEDIQRNRKISAILKRFNILKEGINE